MDPTEDVTEQPTPADPDVPVSTASNLVPRPSAPPPPIFLPRHVVIAGAVLFVAGLVATIVLVATQSACNSATNLTAVSPGGISGACSQHHSLLAAGYLALFVGACMITFGGMLLPTLQAKRVREWAAKHPPQP